ncbi:class II histocompatibility antigen, B-L beta chain-like [Boleophthalmus pectinirostris]|uniref:class II histocompatibility antigen, B-L beta chain-like n=1 Tax=Boleophthalmus pectinirostris TaxID=150288 RepID=UPI000A1C1E60|nr:class II histocompatibility antigen, B-L beta chain-like [Boleophthalmus pectinirostris]
MDLTIFAFNRLHLFLYLTAWSVNFGLSDYEVGRMSACCTFLDGEKHLFEYLLTYRYNRNLFMQYNSTRGNWIGFTAYSSNWADLYNNDPEDSRLRKLEQLLLCLEGKEFLPVIKNRTATPSLTLTTVEQSGQRNPALLLCSAYNFYPQEIQMTWLLNGEEITSAVTSTDVLYSGDLYYQIHSYLEHRPRPGEEVSCMVEHVSLPEPLVQVWDPHPPLPRSERVKIAVGTFFLVVGLTALVTGFIKHKKRTPALCTVMHGLAPVPVEHEEESLN